MACREGNPDYGIIIRLFCQKEEHDEALDKGVWNE